MRCTITFVLLFAGFLSGPPAHTSFYQPNAAVHFESVLPMSAQQLQHHGDILENPLKDTHDYKLVCHHCFHFDNFPGMYTYHAVPHKCEENILSLCQKGSPQWMRVRERVNHRDFHGNYIFCNSVKMGKKALCRYGEDNCSYAHNDVEQYMWMLEKDGAFNITEFILQHRSTSNSARGFSLEELLKKHGGFFIFVCRACFYSSPPCISEEGPNNRCCGTPSHSWSDYRILAHFGLGGATNIVNPRGFMHKSAFFKICKYLHYCSRRINGECKFAHSVVERDLWMLERDIGITRDKIVALSNQLCNRQPRSSTVPSHTTGPVPPTSAPAPPAAQSTTPGPWKMPTPAGAANFSEIPSRNKVSHTVADSDPQKSCPFIIQEICNTCWKNGTKSIQDGDKDRCEKSHSNWQSNRTYFMPRVNKELRPLPRKIPGGMNFMICRYLREKKKCGFTGAGLCQFAHYELEIEVWKWMCSNNSKLFCTYTAD